MGDFGNRLICFWTMNINDMNAIDVNLMTLFSLVCLDFQYLLFFVEFSDGFAIQISSDAKNN